LAPLGVEHLLVDLPGTERRRFAAAMDALRAIRG
jgi:hypothetical protein